MTVTWPTDRIGSRRARRDRERRVPKGSVLQFVTTQQWFKNAVEMMEEAHPPYEVGRPRIHSHATVLLFRLIAIVEGSGRKGEAYMTNPTIWDEIRRTLAKEFPDDALLADGAPAPTRSLLRHYASVFDEDVIKWVAKQWEPSWIGYATEMGIGTNKGTNLEPSTNATAYGDSVVLRPMSKHPKGTMAYNPRTGQLQERRYDADASNYVNGMNQHVTGTKFVHISASTGRAQEQITFSVEPLVDKTGRTEADIACDMAARLKNELGFTGFSWDKALRGEKVEHIWRLGIQPFVGVYDKTKTSTKTVSLGETTINKIRVELIATGGAVCIVDRTGTPQPLAPTKLEYQPNADGTVRPYVTYIVPHTIDCDTRLWGGTTKVRMTTPKGNDLIRGEHLRALIPGSDKWKQQYGVRSLAESLNSWFKSFFQRGERVRSKSRLGQWLDLLLLAAWRNTVSLLEYRYRRVRNHSATAPPT